MSYPDFTDLFNILYDQFSIHEADFSIPSYFNVYYPDNLSDYQCISIIVPSPEKGASSWTQDGKFLTIGIYRDEGRPTSQRLPITGLSWTRQGRSIIITTPTYHKLHNGDLINISNVNVQTLGNLIVSVIDNFNFSVPTLAYGATSGLNATFQDNFKTNFYENYVVFRLLPSFQLVPYSTIESIINNTAPIPYIDKKTLYNINTLATVNIPSDSNNSINYKLSSYTRNPGPSLTKRFGQLYDSIGNPLLLKYSSYGFPIAVNNVDSIYSNDQIFNNLAINGISDPYVYSYDFYGFPLNDITRGPTYSLSNISSKTTVIGYINNIDINITIGYSSTVNDLFGNLAIGIQQNNALTIRKQILPLQLNIYNQPIKQPIK